LNTTENPAKVYVELILPKVFSIDSSSRIYSISLLIVELIMSFTSPGRASTISLKKVVLSAFTEISGLKFPLLAPSRGLNLTLTSL
jgi:hypothetical protein